MSKSIDELMVEFDGKTAAETRQTIGIPSDGIPDCAVCKIGFDASLNRFFATYSWERMITDRRICYLPSCMQPKTGKCPHEIMICGIVFNCQDSDGHDGQHHYCDDFDCEKVEIRWGEE